MSELAQLKSQLRSLVVSSPTAVDARALLRDYRTLVGEPLPAARHGYRDPVHFLRERCADCFLFRGPTNNPELTLIVPDQLKHIDEFVQRQKIPSTKSFKVKRRSIPETNVRPSQNLVTNTYIPPERRKAIIEEPHNNIQVQPERLTPERRTPEKKPERVLVKQKAESVSNLCSHNGTDVKDSHDPPNETIVNCNGAAKNRVMKEEGADTQRVLHRFLEKRMPLYQSQLRRPPSADSLQDDDSGRQTASSGSSGSKQLALERLREEVGQLLAERPDGLWASQLMRLYEQRFGRELNYARLGFASIAACACACAAGSRAPDGDWLLRAPASPASPACPAPPAPPAPLLRRLPRPAPPPATPVDPDDALPGIEYDPDVFPADCLSFVESIPIASVADINPGDMIQLEVGEVYSPSHLWILRLGPEHDQMEDIMDEMTEYFTKGEGVNRVLAAGARRPGQYCCSVYDGDWHRSLIVQLVDADTVKVRHVDYGTVDTVAATSLRPLRRAWAALPAQAVRARLAGLRPPAAGRRWPRAAAAHCLRLVRDTRLVGNVLCVEPEEGIVELLLIDTSTSEDVSVTDEMIRAGHADPRPRAALGASEAYLFPLFGALEAGATPNFAEIHALLRDGIALDYVPAYRRHVPPLLPAAWAPEPYTAPRADQARPERLRYGPAAPAPHTLEHSLYTPKTTRHSHETPPYTLEASSYPNDTLETESPESDPESPRSTPSPPAAPGPADSDDSPAVAPALVNRVPLIWMTASEPALDGPAKSTPTAIRENTQTTEKSVMVPETPTKKEKSTPIINSKTFSQSTEKVTPSVLVSQTSQTETSTPIVVSETPAQTGEPSAARCTPATTTAVPASQAEPTPPLRPVNRPAAPQPLPGPPRHPAAFYAIPPGYYPLSRFPPAPQFAQYPVRFAHPPGFYQTPRAAQLSADECEVFELLSLVDKNAAHRYVSQALRRSLAALPGPPAPPAGHPGHGPPAPPAGHPGHGPPAPASLNPLAPEFRATRPPPGFERVAHQYFPQPPQRR